MNRERAASLDARLWGKERGLPTPYPVVCHLLDTAAVAAVLWDELLGDPTRQRIASALGLGLEDARSVVSFWAGLHDLGKISPPFQGQVPDVYSVLRNESAFRCAPGAEKLREFRHEMATHWALTGLLREVGYPDDVRMSRAVGHQVAQLLGGHHGCFGQVLKRKELARPSEYQQGLGEEGWARQRELHFEEVRRVVGAHPVPTSGLSAGLAVTVAGLVVVADWLASQTEAVLHLMPPDDWRGAPEELDAHWERSRLRASEARRAARLGRARFPACSFEEIFPFGPNGLQGDIAEHLPRLIETGEGGGSGLLLVTAPTGDGKTEAALYAASVLGRASGARGLYFALPTMATADAMYARVREFADSAVTGERALTLLHSMAWLSPAYAVGAGGGADENAARVSADDTTATEAGEWLRGWRRGMLASLSVGTIDQALSAVLPITHNALRLFGLSDKVFVVDEAHAYGPWMHSLLVRLLEWLGAFKAPVVLLSATLTGRTATSLVDAYRRGAGFLEASRIEPAYPGWLFTHAATGEVFAPRSVKTARPRTVDTKMRKVSWDMERRPGGTPRTRDRGAALRELLKPVAEEGGTALVCCTTVADAQHTFRDLRFAFPELARREGGLRVLHSRFAGVDRGRITAACEADYGKSRKAGGSLVVRPGSILVATSVVEQSLDFDFDLVVSDLAPLAQLLQRAGRGRRHHRGPLGRPSWARDEDRPRLEVLVPSDSDASLVVPRHWGHVYDAGILERTVRLLDRPEQREGIAVPQGVQPLIDAVYTRAFVDELGEAAGRDLRRRDAEREAQEMAETQQAQIVTVSSPGDVAGDLHKLSREVPGVTEELLTTRLGADTGRLLCQYEQPEGEVTLDAGAAVPVPLPRRKGEGLARDQLACVVAHTVPVPGRWLRGGAGEELPRGWAGHPLLRDLVLVRLRPEADGRWCGRHGDLTLVSSDVGLEAK